MTLDLSPDELLTTTRTVRKRLDFSRPVPREMIQDCIDVAVQAPTGGNKQIWHWVVVGDDKVKSAVADVYRRCWDTTSRNGALPSYDGADPRAGRIAKILESGQHLADNIDLVALAGHTVRHWARARSADTARAIEVLGIGTAGDVEFHACRPRPRPRLRLDVLASAK